MRNAVFSAEEPSARSRSNKNRTLAKLQVVLRFKQINKACKKSG